MILAWMSSLQSKILSTLTSYSGNLVSMEIQALSIQVVNEIKDAKSMLVVMKITIDMLLNKLKYT